MVKRFRSHNRNQFCSVLIFYDFVCRDFAGEVIFYWPAVEPLADACGTLGFRGTPVENHWSRQWI